MKSRPWQVLGTVAYGFATAAGLYAVLLGVLLTPRMQRFALYANNFNTLWLRGLADGQLFGFAKNQVTPFTLKTPDGETLYAWHVLPVDRYALHEAQLQGESSSDGPVEDFTKTIAFKLLTAAEGPPPRVVVSFHGNAGDIAQGWRPDTIRHLTTQPNTHVFTLDYRGFGLSSGLPTEEGLITDGVTLVKWIMEATKVPSEQILILGQSLGTAVASAVALSFADPKSNLLPAGVAGLREFEKVDDIVTFASVILVAPFNSIPTLLSTYRIGGLLPLLLPLRAVPLLTNLLTSQVVDKWLTAERLAAYYHGLKDKAQLFKAGRNMGSLQIIHAINDADIPYRQTTMICRRMLGLREAQDALDGNELEPPNCIDGSRGAGVLKVEETGLPKLRFELLPHGGHNRIVTYTPVAVAVARAFEDL